MTQENFRICRIPQVGLSDTQPEPIAPMEIGTKTNITLTHSVQTKTPSGKIWTLGGVHQQFYTWIIKEF